MPLTHVIPVQTTLDWATLGAIPEMFGTAWGSLEQLRLRSGDSLLIHGGSSSVGMAATTIAKDRGATVLTTTRQAAKRDALAANGADHVLIDDGGLAAKVREIAPGGVTGLYELVGAAALLDSLHARGPGRLGQPLGRACGRGAALLSRVAVVAGLGITPAFASRSAVLSGSGNVGGYPDLPF